MIRDFKGDFGSSPEEDSSNIKIGDFSIDSQSSITIFSESFQSLQEPSDQVTGHEHLFAFTFNLFISDLPHGESIIVKVIKQELDGFFLIFGVSDEGFPVKEIESSGGQ